MFFTSSSSGPVNSGRAKVSGDRARGRQRLRAIQQQPDKRSHVIQVRKGEKLEVARAREVRVQEFCGDLKKAIER